MYCNTSFISHLKTKINHEGAWEQDYNPVPICYLLFLICLQDNEDLEEENRFLDSLQNNTQFFLSSSSLVAS